jgi:hypothetical protein
MELVQNKRSANLTGLSLMTVVLQDLPFIALGCRIFFGEDADATNNASSQQLRTVRPVAAPVPQCKQACDVQAVHGGGFILLSGGPLPSHLDGPGGRKDYWAA